MAINVLTADLTSISADTDEFSADNDYTLVNTGLSTVDRTFITTDSDEITVDGYILVAQPFNVLDLFTPGAALYEIPLAGGQQTFTIDLVGATYRLRFTYAAAVEGGWILDIGDAADSPLACGIPLVTGVDLLEPYDYLGFGGKLFVVTVGDTSATPTPDGLGTASRLFFEAA